MYAIRSYYGVEFRLVVGFDHVNQAQDLGIAVIGGLIGVVTPCTVAQRCPHDVWHAVLRRHHRIGASHHVFGDRILWRMDIDPRNRFGLNIAVVG